jgi:Co/Zn/Cd efflux system component
MLALVGFGITACVQGIGVLITHGLSLEGDTWHVASDALGALLGFVAMHKALQRWTPEQSQGGVPEVPETYRLLIMLLLFVSSVVIFRKVFGRLLVLDPIALVEPGVMLLTACFGLLMNFVLLGVYNGLRLPHEHTGQCHHEHRSVSQDLLLGNIAHALQDTLSSTTVIALSGGVLWYPSPGWRFVDAVLSFLIGMWLVRISWRMHQAFVAKT